MLRYQINDSSRERVSLASDIRFLNDYLNLEKIRRDNFQFTLRQEGEVDSIWIQPLLFIPFVENAVKHSFDSEYSSYVHVFLRWMLTDWISGVRILNRLLQSSRVKSVESDLPISSVG